MENIAALTDSVDSYTDGASYACNTHLHPPLSAAKKQQRRVKTWNPNTRLQHAEKNSTTNPERHLFIQYDMFCEKETD